MRTLLNLLAAIAVIAPAAGCGLYFGNNNNNQCDPTLVGSPPGGAPQTFRNPQDGTCQSFGGWVNTCGGEAPPQARPDWATCDNQCSNLDEATCLATSACRGAYLDVGPQTCPVGVPCDPIPPKFLGCWGTAPTGPISAGSCVGLDAQSCSEHDNCTAHYVDTGLVYGPSFSVCVDEPQQGGSCATVDMICPTGSHCADICPSPQPGPGPLDGGVGPGSGGALDGGVGSGSGGTLDGGVPTVPVPPPGYCTPTCVPDAPQTCDQVACMPGSHCQLDCLPCDPNNPTADCMATCSPTCVPDAPACAATDCGPGFTCVESCSAGGMNGSPLGTCTIACVPVPPNGPGDCIGPLSCNSAPPACPAATVAGIANGCYTGYCIPVAACGPLDPGSCAGAVACATPPPSCPADTVAGVANGCWSGFCIPLAACPAPTCDQLTTEAGCIARPDCTSVYQGVDCTCTSAGCTCASEIFERCQQSLFLSPPAKPTTARLTK